MVREAVDIDTESEDRLKEKTEEVTGEVIDLEFNLKLVNNENELREELTKGVPHSFLKLYFYRRAIDSPQDIQTYSPLCEYCIDELIITDSHMKIVSSFKIPDSISFNPKSIAIFLISKQSVLQGTYAETLLALHSQDNAIDFNDKQLVHLTINITF